MHNERQIERWAKNMDTYQRRGLQRVLPCLLGLVVVVYRTEKPSLILIYGPLSQVQWGWPVRNIETQAVDKGLIGNKVSWNHKLIRFIPGQLDIFNLLSRSEDNEVNFRVARVWGLPEGARRRWKRGGELSFKTHILLAILSYSWGALTFESQNDFFHHYKSSYRRAEKSWKE